MELIEHKNVWRKVNASRAAVLIDAASTFEAVRKSMLQARRSIMIVGWDIDSRTRLVGPTGHADDGLPETLAEFLSALVERQPELTVYLLLWDYSVLYSLEREIFPALSLNWRMPNQVRFCLDDKAPLGCSQHQKLVVVDDEIAFSGGLDLTIRRWDTSAHEAENPHRVDPSGDAYHPFHDVQVVVDGEAGRALAELSRQRWNTALGCQLDENANQANDCWPVGLLPDFSDVDVGIARTQPCDDETMSVREVELLFLDMIDAAKHSIYIENQFLTSELIAERLARQLKCHPDLELVIVAPDTPESWIEAHTMRNGRVRFRRILEEAGCPDRWRLVAPVVRSGDETVTTMVHSKVMIVDDHMVRIGSANLNNRSMGADSECDLVFIAKSTQQTASVRSIRTRLLADHCGATVEEVESALRESKSLVDIVDGLSRRGHSLRPIEDGDEDPGEFSQALEMLADPPQPWRSRSVADLSSMAVRLLMYAPGLKVALAAVAFVGLALAWYFSPLAAYAQPSNVQQLTAALQASYWGPVIAIGAFILGGTIAFPLTILIVATIAAFGGWPGAIYAGAGAMISALTSYALGVLLGRRALGELLGKRIDQVRHFISRGGVAAVVAARLVPLAPFTVVNVSAGALGVDLWLYTIGTFLGLAPGITAIAVFSEQVFHILERPTPTTMALLALSIAGWIALMALVQAAISKVYKVQ